MTGQSRRDQLNAEILECVSELIARVIGHGEQLCQSLSIPAPFMKALHIMDCPMAMKELGKRMHCDPSFVTIVADMLEKRGLARREPHPADRRVKNLSLTDAGIALRQRLEAEMTARMPWNQALSDDERTQLLALIRKMLNASPDAGAMDAADGNGDTLADGRPEHAPSVTPASPRDTAGEVSGAVSEVPVRG
jgi:MarR family transcriptional regulator, organic hydroperoxide resistance regulator